MRFRCLIMVPVFAVLSACASSGGPFPSLQPRAAEAIDPRVPIVRPINDRPVTPAIASRLAELLTQARSGNAGFDSIAARAESLAAAAGGPQSDSWVAAQEALSQAVAARDTTARALGDIDELGSTMLQSEGGLAPNDLAAIQRAGAEAAALDQLQADRIKALQQRLGL
jgi:hypothetical protein